MTNTYNKPETKIIKMELQQIMAGSIGQVTNSDPVTPGTEDAKGFGFFFEEEEVAGKSDDDDWEEWEDEEDP